MNLSFNKLAVLGVGCFVALSTALSLQGCSDDEETKWVDLRYRVEDSYLLDAKNPKPVTFLVKSTDPWEVYGLSDWHTITPAQGEPNQKTEVTISCQENTNLDDRTDTIHIKSDYWIGKRFTITQKGIAFLNVDGLDIIEQLGGMETFQVLSNQKWTARVTKGEIWLQIEKGESGEQNGEIVVKATANMGEQRMGEVTVFDRHGKPAQVVQIVQAGVVLNPVAPDNGKWFVLYEEAQQLRIPVESNAEWTVCKENEADEDWYTFEKTTFSGSDEIVVNVSKHEGSRVRTGKLILSTKSTEGATPVMKIVRFKQANPQIPEVHELNKVIKGNYYGPGGLMPGRYNFYFKPFGATFVKLFFIWGDVELRFWVRNKKTELSTRPWCSDVFAEHSGCIHAVDTSKPNVLSLDIREQKDEKDPSKSWIYSEWILNDKVIAHAVSDGKNSQNGTDDTWKVPFNQILDGGNFMVGTDGGSAELQKFEFIAPLVWGD